MVQVSLKLLDLMLERLLDVDVFSQVSQIGLLNLRRLTISVAAFERIKVDRVGHPGRWRNLFLSAKL